MWQQRAKVRATDPIDEDGTRLVVARQLGTIEMEGAESLVVVVHLLVGALVQLVDERLLRAILLVQLLAQVLQSCCARQTTI